MRFAALLAALAVAVPAFAADGITSLHPEEAYPDNAPRMTSPGPYAPLIEQVQHRLKQEGFDAGPVNGDFGSKTQAALAQFQLSRNIPVSGMLDDRTLDELGVYRQQRPSDGKDQSEAQG